MSLPRFSDLTYSNWTPQPANCDVRAIASSCRRNHSEFWNCWFVTGGEVLARAEIRERIWCDSFVDFEQGLNFCIRQIREALGDTADAPRFIETLPRRGYRFLLPVETPPAMETKAPRSLIVLPFRMLRSDPGADFLAFSLPEALTTSLSGVKSLVVRSSLAASRFEVGAQDLRTIAAEAHVDLIVTGTLLSTGYELRVTAQLTDAATGTLMCSHATQTSIGDVFRLQDELTECIVEALSLQLTSHEQRILRHDVPADPKAYEYYLPLRYCGLLEASVAAYARAVALEPTIRTSIVHTWFLQRDNKRVASTKLEDNPYIVALSLTEVGRGKEAVGVLRTLEEKIKTRMRDFMVAARTMIEGDVEGSIAAVGRIVQSAFNDPEGLFYLTRHLAHLNQVDAALGLFERAVGGGIFCYPAMFSDPWLDPIRQRPEFVRLLERVEQQHQVAAREFARLEGNRILGIASRASRV